MPVKNLLKDGFSESFKTLNFRVSLVLVALAVGWSVAQAQENRQSNRQELADSTDQEEVVELVSITVYGKASQVDLTGTYSGNQISRGVRAGLLGNLDYIDSPFSGTGYTQDLIDAQLSESIGDVLLNDPTVRVTKGFGNFQEVYIVRGFPVFSDDITLNGLFGILPRQFVAAEFVERVEVFRGANAFINGAAPGGSGVGGTINLVQKRAPQGGLRRVTLGYEQQGQFYSALDLANRFGVNDDWGVRLNGIFRDGESAVDDQERELGGFSLNTDYAGDRFRLSADIGYQDNRINDPRPQVTPLGQAPDEPEADANYALPGTFSDEEQLFGVIRGEYDLTDAFKVWAAVGGRRGEENNVLANPNSDADGNTTAFRFDNSRKDAIFSADIGARSEFFTGPVGHTLVVSASVIDIDEENAFALSDFINTIPGNLYQPATIDSLPPADFFTGGDLSDPLTTLKTTNQSIAIADTLAFFDSRLLITAGFRYQEIETRSFDFNTGEELSRFDEDAVTPVFGAVYKASDRFAMYANYAESLEPGETAPEQVGSLPILNAGEVLDPFRGEQAELGAKYDSDAFGATVSLFTLSRQNAIVVDQMFRDDGEQHSRGLEASFYGQPVVGLRLIGGFTFIDAEFSETQDGVNEGNTPIGIPDFQASINAEWDVPFMPGLAVDGRIIYTGDQYINEVNTFDIDQWTRLDLGLSYETFAGSIPITIRARLDNVMNEAYWATVGGFPGANYLIQGEPRTFSLRVSADF